jgi:hypothetical protein
MLHGVRNNQKDHEHVFLQIRQEIMDVGSVVLSISALQVGRPRISGCFRSNIAPLIHFDARVLDKL